MKVDLLKIIENALIGGRYGDVNYIYNNQLTRELFDSYKKEKAFDSETEKFKDFLKSVLNEEQEETVKQESVSLTSFVTLKESAIKEVLKGSEKYDNFIAKKREFEQSKNDLITSSRDVVKELSDSTIRYAFEDLSDYNSKLFRFNVKSLSFEGKLDVDKLIEEKGEIKCLK